MWNKYYILDLPGGGGGWGEGGVIYYGEGLPYYTGMYQKCISKDSNTHEIVHKEEFDDTKRVFRICKSKKDRQLNGQKKKGQNDIQRSTKQIYKTKDRVTQTPLKTGGELRCSRRVSSSCSTSGTRRDFYCIIIYIAQ